MMWVFNDAGELNYNLADSIWGAKWETEEDKKERMGKRQREHPS